MLERARLGIWQVVQATVKGLEIALGGMQADWRIWVDSEGYGELPNPRSV
jgi:hypothetical protein